MIPLIGQQKYLMKSLKEEKSKIKKGGFIKCIYS